MPSILIEQALYHRPDRQSPTLVARSSGFDDAWLAESERIILSFGDRTHGLRCPLTVFALPLGKKHVAVVRVVDVNPDFPTGLRFHFAVVERKIYEQGIRDPFHLAEKIEPAWDASGTMPTLMLAQETFNWRTLAAVQSVLKRVKTSALKKGENPESPDFERTVENSESPMLLGSAQILVDGGRLAFERQQGDLRMVSGLWMLLPEATRSRLWPTSFAFSTDLDFDVVVLPQFEGADVEGYTTEQQAIDYPEGAYELALQRAAEHGDQGELDAVFSRRDSKQTIKLAIGILIVLSVVVLMSRWLDMGGTPRPALTQHQQQAAAAAGIVAVAEPWTAVGMIVHGKAVWKGEDKNGKK
ncbi:MAG TPA: hypothetical protein VFE62_17565 [Gemmataceae bacterium]|nr:hypothetical protein [Gemmataceae bacterium]